MKIWFYASTNNGCHRSQITSNCHIKYIQINLFEAVTVGTIDVRNSTNLDGSEIWAWQESGIWLQISTK